MQQSIALKGATVSPKGVRPIGGRAPRCLVRAGSSDNGSTAVKERKLSPLERGGTLAGAAAAGKDASDKFKAMAEGKDAATGPVMAITEDGKFRDYRWVNGRWDLGNPQFKASSGEVDWDAVIDAEMARRKLLEDTPIPCINEEPVNFDTSEIPWWAWVRRFHLPEAEKLNGRAAMLGYVLAIFVDKLSGAGLIDQQESFLGKIALHICVFGVLIVRNVSDIDSIKNLIDEATFYDKQWNATWENQERPSEE